MTNDEQLVVIKQGATLWNRWRDEHQEIALDLSGARLYSADLRKANLAGADLRDADLRKANLADANLRDANLRDANLSGANLRDANLRDANLSGADLNSADLSGADLDGADLSGATIGWTSFGDRDFRVIKGLETVAHDGPSPLSMHNLHLSGGDIPETFVRQTGASDTFINYMLSLANNSIE